GDSTEIPVAAGAAGRSSGRAGVPVAFAFETTTSAGVGFTIASLAFSPGAGVCASANCVPSSAFTSRPGIGLGSIAGTDDSVWAVATAAAPTEAVGVGEETAMALFNQPRS